MKRLFTELVNEPLIKNFIIIWINKVGHLLSELGFDPHSIARFRDLTSILTKQNSIASFDFNSDS